MKSQTPLNDLLSGAQEYLKLEAKAVRLKTFISLADTAYGTARILPVVIAGSIALLFFGVAVSLLLATFLPAAAAFAITAVIFLLMIPLALTVLARKEETLKSRVLSGLTNTPTNYVAVKAEYKNTEAEKSKKIAALEVQLSGLKERSSRIERMLTPSDETKGKVAGNLLRSAAGTIVRHALLPKAGVIGKIAAPVIAGAVLRSTPVKKIATRLISLLRRK